MAKNIKNLIVGAGLSGATLAYKIASEFQEEVWVVDAKPHLAGNCYDFYNEHNICVHQYGAHVFHTNSAEVWNFLSQFTAWYPYAHLVRGIIQGKEVPIPFNLNAIYQCFSPNQANKLVNKLIQAFGMNVKVPILKLREFNDLDLSELAEFVYENVFLHYTLKQWGTKPENLSAAVTGRVPVFISWDNRYFQDLYQAIPLKGYSAMVQKMLNHPLIHLKLNTPFTQDLKYDRLFWTGAIDEFFNYELGELPYRSLSFDFQTLNQPYFQSNSVINYPNEQDYTRISEYKYFLNDQTNQTTISYEYPQPFKRGENERYYPIIQAANQERYRHYLAKAKAFPHVYFLGRLGDYAYYNMDQAVAKALSLFTQLKNNYLLHIY